MSLKTRFGNLGNVYDEDPSQTRILQLESPVADRDRARGGQATISARNLRTLDCTFDAGPDSRIRTALDRIRQEAEEAVRGGCETLILSDEGVGPDRAPIPMILAVGAVHSHLVRQGLRSFSYLIASERRVPGHALLRRADRRRRHRGQRVPCRGRDRRPPRARPVPRPRRSRTASPASRRRSTRACSR